MSRKGLSSGFTSEISRVKISQSVADRFRSSKVMKLLSVAVRYTRRSRFPADKVSNVIKRTHSFSGHSARRIALSATKWTRASLSVIVFFLCWMDPRIPNRLPQRRGFPRVRRPGFWLSLYEQSEAVDLGQFVQPRFGHRHLFPMSFDGSLPLRWHQSGLLLESFDFVERFVDELKVHNKKPAPDFSGAGSS